MERISLSLLLWITGIVVIIFRVNKLKKKLRNLINITFKIAATFYI